MGHATPARPSLGATAAGPAVAKGGFSQEHLSSGFTLPFRSGGVSPRSLRAAHCAHHTAELGAGFPFLV